MVTRQASHCTGELMAEQQVHILGLSPKEQYLLRILLGNLMAGYLDKSLQESGALRTQDQYDAKSAQMIELFNRYNDMVDMLCTEHTVNFTKPKVIKIKPFTMKYILAAVNGYDPKQNFLGTEHNRSLANGFLFLKEKILMSAKFVYQQDEIERAKKS